MTSVARVARLLGPGSLVWEEQKLEAPRDGELRARTVFSAISVGTELAAWEGLPPLGTAPAYPRLMGYCNVARIEALGTAHPSLSVGDLVLTHQSHRTAFVCKTGDVLLKLSAKTDARAATALYLGQLALAALQRAEAVKGEALCVQGMGALGLSAVCLGAARGMRVTALSNDASRAALARKFGAHESLERPAQPADESADVIVSTVNGWDAWRQVLKAAKPNARIAVLGFPGRGQPLPTENPLDSSLFYRKQLSILASGYPPGEGHRWGGGDTDARARANLALLEQLLNDGTFPAHQLLTHEFEGEALAAAYTQLAKHDKAVVGAVLRWGDA